MKAKRRQARKSQQLEKSPSSLPESSPPNASVVAGDGHTFNNPRVNDGELPQLPSSPFDFNVPTSPTLADQPDDYDYDFGPGLSRYYGSAPVEGHASLIEKYTRYRHKDELQWKYIPANQVVPRLPNAREHYKDATRLEMAAKEREQTAMKSNLMDRQEGKQKNTAENNKKGEDKDDSDEEEVDKTDGDKEDDGSTKDKEEKDRSDDEMGGTKATQAVESDGTSGSSYSKKQRFLERQKILGRKAKSPDSNGGGSCEEDAIDTLKTTKASLTVAAVGKKRSSKLDRSVNKPVLTQPSRRRAQSTFNLLQVVRRGTVQDDGTSKYSFDFNSYSYQHLDS